MAQKIKKGQFDYPTIVSANGSFAYQIGPLLICWGVTSVSSAGTTINFAQAFSANPTVSATMQDPNNWNAWTTGMATTYFIAKQAYTSAALPVNWIAIGPA